MARTRFNSTYRQDARLIQSNARWFWIIVLVVALLYVPHMLVTRQFFGSPLSNNQVLGLSLSQINVALISIIAAIALNVLTGYTGLISVGNAGFFALGRRNGRVLQRPAPPTVPAGARSIPRSPARSSASSSACRHCGCAGCTCCSPPWRSSRSRRTCSSSTRRRTSARSARRTNPPVVIGKWDLTTDTRWYFFLLVLVVLTIIGAKNLLRTRQGRALVAVRDQDIAAASAGINVAMVKLQVFALTSAVITVAGCMYTWYLGHRRVRHLLDRVRHHVRGDDHHRWPGLGQRRRARCAALLAAPAGHQDGVEQRRADAPIIGHLLNKQAAQVNDIILGVIIILVVIFKPGGLNGIWVSLKQFFLRWPYTS